MSSNRRWMRLREPHCNKPHPTVGYLCGWNAGHDGDHNDGILFNSWPNEPPPAEVTFRARVRQVEHGTCELHCGHTHKVWRFDIIWHQGDDSYVAGSGTVLDWATAIASARLSVKEAYRLDQ